MSEAHKARRIALRSFKPLHKGTLIGFAQITIPIGSFDLEVDDVVVARSGDRLWASLPGKPTIGREGEILRNEETGKPAYSAFLRWSSKAQRDAFSNAVIAAVKARHPDAFDH